MGASAYQQDLLVRLPPETLTLGSRYTEARPKASAIIAVQ